MKEADIVATSKQTELIGSALSGDYSMILYGGAVGGAKTFGLYLLFLAADDYFPGIQICFTRKDLTTIRRNSYASWEEIVNKFGVPGNIKKDNRQDTSNPYIETKNGSRLIFFGENYDKDKDLTRWNGLVVNWFFADEINELQYKSYLKMYERAGRYQIKGRQPHTLIVATCNPTQNWVKQHIYDKWANGTLPDHIKYIPAKSGDNPNLPPGYIETLKKTLPYYEYMVRVEGNWDIKLKTGNEFWKCFSTDKHVSGEGYDPAETLHASIDDNYYPYITVTLWQVFTETKEIRQVGEVLAKDPDNTVSRAAKLLVEWLEEKNYKDTLFLYGDRSTKNRNTLDDDKRTFFQKFKEVVEDYTTIRDMMTGSNPPVSNSADFINAMYEHEIEGWKIRIFEQCYESINDYIEVKQDRDGKMLKKRITDKDTGISYEPNGHISDTKRYLIMSMMDDVYKKWLSKKEVKPISISPDFSLDL